MLMIAAGMPRWPQAAPPPSLAPSSTPASSHRPRKRRQTGRAASVRRAAAREENPGLINEMGKLFEKSLSILPTLKSPGETIDDLNARAKDAPGRASLSRLAKPASMVTGRMGCPVAANGAPDCKAGADKLCQTKGYKEGKSLDTDSAEKCSAKVYMPGHKREAGRLPDRKLRHPRAVPVASGDRACRERDCLVGMMSGIFQADAVTSSTLASNNQKDCPECPCLLCSRAVCRFP